MGAKIFHLIFPTCPLLGLFVWQLIEGGLPFCANVVMAVDSKQILLYPFIHPPLLSHKLQ